MRPRNRQRLDAAETTLRCGAGPILRSPPVPGTSVCADPASRRRGSSTGPEVLDVVDVPELEAGPGHTLHTVSTAGVYYADTHHRESVD